MHGCACFTWLGQQHRVFRQLAHYLDACGKYLLYRGVAPTLTWCLRDVTSGPVSSNGYNRCSEDLDQVQEHHV